MHINKPTHTDTRTHTRTLVWSWNTDVGFQYWTKCYFSVWWKNIISMRNKAKKWLVIYQPTINGPMDWRTDGRLDGWTDTYFYRVARTDITFCVQPHQLFGVHIRPFRKWNIIEPLGGCMRNLVLVLKTFSFRFSCRKIIFVAPYWDPKWVFKL